MTATSFHHTRVREQLQKELGRIIANDIRDPRVPPIVTVTDVRLSPDMRNATVFISILGGTKEQKGVCIALNNASAYIQRTLGSRVILKYMPRLFFKIDKSLEQGSRINDLLKEIQDDLV